MFPETNLRHAQRGHMTHTQTRHRQISLVTPRLHNNKKTHQTLKTVSFIVYGKLGITFIFIYRKTTSKVIEVYRVYYFYLFNSLILPCHCKISQRRISLRFHQFLARCDGEKAKGNSSLRLVSL